MKFSPPRMDPTESRAWLALVGTSMLLPAALDSELQTDAGMTHFEFLLLGMLNLAPDHTMRMKSLADESHATLPRLSKAVSRLEERGWVARVPCPEDKRATNARLTQDGRRAMILATPGHLATVRRHVLDLLDHDQQVALAEILEPVLAGLDARLRGGPVSARPAAGGDADAADAAAADAEDAEAGTTATGAGADAESV